MKSDSVLKDETALRFETSPHTFQNRGLVFHPIQGGIGEDHIMAVSNVIPVPSM